MNLNNGLSSLWVGHRPIGTHWPAQPILKERRCKPEMSSPTPINFEWLKAPQGKKVIDV